jgi:hypothetical protein
MNPEDCIGQEYLDMLKSINWDDSFSLSHVDNHEESESTMSVTKNNNNNKFYRLLKPEPIMVSPSFVMTAKVKDHSTIFNVDCSDSVSSTAKLKSPAMIGMPLVVAVPPRIHDPALLEHQTTNTSSENSSNQANEQIVTESKNKEEVWSSSLCQKKGPQSREYVKIISDWDVMFGNGSIARNHIGNRKYRDEVYTLHHWSTCRETELAQYLVSYIHSSGGRFLKMDESNNQWYIVPNSLAHRKVSQALRR